MKLLTAKETLEMFFLISACILSASSFTASRSVRVVIVVTVWFGYTRTLSVRFRFYYYNFDVGQWRWIQKHSLVFTVVSSLSSRPGLEPIILLLQKKLLFFLAGAEIHLFLFNLWRLCALFIQTVTPLLVTELLVSDNLVITDELRYTWREGKEKHL